MVLHAIAAAAGTSLEAIVEYADMAEDLILKRGDVEIYCTWKDDDTQSESWVATAFRAPYEGGGAFDVRELDDIPEEELPKYEAEFPGDEDKQRLAYAIDQGAIDADGLVDG